MPEHLIIEMPEHLIIEMLEHAAFLYERKEIGAETIYVCNKGSDWARSNEVLVLRCWHGTWTAFDGCLNADGSTFLCRQPVYRCNGKDITKPGWYQWQTNVTADATNQAGLDVQWHGLLWAETRLP